MNERVSSSTSVSEASTSHSLWYRLIGWLLNHRLLVGVSLTLFMIGGLLTQPFWALRDVWSGEESALSELRRPISVDALPHMGEHQQVILTEWSGRSPKEVEDHITYPLTVQLLGTSGVKTIRSSSLFGVSYIYVIFKSDQDQSWARAQLLESLASLPADTIPQGVKPTLGPDATALGQVYWYVLEGQRVSDGSVTNSWDLEELRSLQDWRVRYALERIEGVAEVSAIGGYVKEFVVEADPEALELYGLSLFDVYRGVKASNLDVGARSLEINRVEHVVRGVGQLRRLSDLEDAVIKTHADHVITVRDVARVTEGPQLRRGALDIDGAESVGGVVVARADANALEVIKRIRTEVERLNQTLPKRSLGRGEYAQVKLRPIYDRGTLIQDTISTLSEALSQQILITLIIVLSFLGSLTSAALITLILPLSLLATFGLMWLLGVQANVMSLAGIAIAIGTMVDMGIILVERIGRIRSDSSIEQISRVERVEAVKVAVAEVAPAVTTSALTTLLSFLPVFALTEAEGKLFHPLAVTKSLALLSALILSITALPVIASVMWRGLRSSRATHNLWTSSARRSVQTVLRLIAIIGALYLLAHHWRPLDASSDRLATLGHVSLIIGVVLAPLYVFVHAYETLLSRALRRPWLTLSVPALLIALGALCWLGSPRFMPERFQTQFRGLDSEFMPAFDEGEFIYMPTLMPHVSFAESLRVLRRLDMDLAAIPEVTQAVGKLGRAESALDPAPVSMFEILISYAPKYEILPNGERRRRWRSHIETPQDLWADIVRVARRPGLTSAPPLMPIQTRLIMLQSGMRASMGLKLQGARVEQLERAGVKLEALVRSVSGVSPESVFAERVVGKPYLELHLRRERLARYGLTVRRAQRALTLTLAGEVATTLIDGRRRFAVRVRGDRVYRDQVEALTQIPIPLPNGGIIPLGTIAELSYVHGPQAIKSEDGQLTSYLTFGVDPASGLSETTVMTRILGAIDQLRAYSSQSALDALEGVTVTAEGSYRQRARSESYLKVLIPISLALILVVLSLQFRRKSTIIMIYGGVLVAISGAFILLWCYHQPWFLNITLFGVDLRALFHVDAVKMSVAVWVGMIALLGVATDDGVVMASALELSFARHAPQTRVEIQTLVIEVARARLVPCLMTTATTLIALLPVITSDGRGADLMRPMAIPSIGGMCLELITLFVVPLLFYARQVSELERRSAKST